MRQKRSFTVIRSDPPPPPNDPPFPNGWCHCVQPHRLAGLPATAIGERACLAVEWDEDALRGTTGALVRFDLRRTPCTADGAGSLAEITFIWSAVAGPGRVASEFGVRIQAAARLHEIVAAASPGDADLAVTHYAANGLTGDVTLSYAIAGAGVDLLEDACHALRVHQRLLSAYSSPPTAAPFALPKLPPDSDTFLRRADADAASAHAFPPGSRIDLFDNIPWDAEPESPSVELVVTGDPSHPLLVVVDDFLEKEGERLAAHRVPLPEMIETAIEESDTRARAQLALWYAGIEALRREGEDIVIHPPRYGVDGVALTYCIRLETTSVGEAFLHGRNAAARLGRAYRERPHNATANEQAARSPDLKTLLSSLLAQREP